MTSFLLRTFGGGQLRGRDVMVTMPPIACLRKRYAKAGPRAFAKADG